MEGIDLSKEIDKILLNSNRLKQIKSGEEIKKLSKKFLGIHYSTFGEKDCVFQGIPIEDVLMGFSLSGRCIVFSKNKFCISNGTITNTDYNVFPIDDFVELRIESSGLMSDSVSLNYKKVGKFNKGCIDSWKRISDQINPFIKHYFDGKLKEEQNRLKEEQNRLEEEQRLEEEKRLKELQVSQTNLLSELDKDGNGQVDIIEGDDFNTLLKKHQKSIVEVDRKYVQQFVKVSSYLKTKKGNIQSIFSSIKDTPNQEVLNQYVEILKDEIHTYNLILFNSLNMIVSLVEDDMITFYEIHEMFDTLNMFDSKHEKDVSQKLINIGVGLKHLMIEIRKMGDQISESIGELSYVTEESNKQLTNQLSEIDSTMKVGNLISTINTYQNYKTNRRLKS